jgi:anti-sigma regulatory factor (Ser/Thr protein kinase)
MSQTSRIFPAEAAALSSIRAFIREEAVRSPFADHADDIVLAVSEAGSNAILHSGTPEILVSWRCVDSTAEVMVQDRGVFRPRVPGLDPERGRGLHMMAAVVDEVSLQEGRPEAPGTLVRLVKHREPAYA